jgi:DNA-binding NtrC family response regulator
VSAERPVLLVVDDEPGIVSLVDRFAQRLGFDVVTRGGGREALARLSVEKADVALVDLRMPDIDGLEVLRGIRADDPDCHVILMTAHASIDTAIEAIKLGAMDYLSKPFDFERLEELLTSVRDEIERRRALLAAESDMAKRLEFCGMVGRGAVMQNLFDRIQRFAPHVRTALVTGETGTGKELVARALHKMGPRAVRRLVTINCSAVVESLFESELFGHTRGAFTGATGNKSGLFEVADGGTLFLDEIGELPLPAQAKLLRVIETGEVQRVGAVDARRVDVRVVAATNRDLRAEAAAGRFRSDLLYRLNVVELHVPPLRERREDIPYLTAAFVREFAAQFQKAILGPTPAAERVLLTAPWPGNVRELRNVIERVCILNDARFFSERELLSCMAPDSARPPRAADTATERSDTMDAGDEDLLAVAERDHIARVLRDAHGNKKAAAQLLGVSRRALYRRLDRLGLR